MCAERAGHDRLPLRLGMAARWWVVISIGALGGGGEAATYYLEHRAGCDLEYYTGAEQSTGRWLGESAQFALTGRIDRRGEDRLRLLLDGRHPGTGERLVPELHRHDETGRRVDARVAGLDVTFSAPKSVSLLHALADPRVADEVLAAHHAAVGEALAHLHAHAGHARRGHHGDGHAGQQIATTGFVAAAFDHVTSRAADPQLHTHVVIANLLHGADGKWSALDTRALYKESKTAGFVYQAVLRGELTTRLGLAWQPVERGLAEARGVPRSVLRVFSRRRTQIETRLAQQGREGPGAAQAACLATRPAKTHQPIAQLRGEWVSRLEAAGLTPTGLVDGMLNLAGSPTLGAAERGELRRALLAPTGLTAHRESFGSRELTQGVCNAVPPGTAVTTASLDRLARGVVTAPEVVPLLPADGEPRWSTRELLATETDALLLAAAAAARPRIPLGVDDGLLAGLSVEQAAAVTALVTKPRGLHVIVGPAGAGKTAALAAAATVWRQAGVPVLGVAVAARAARGLQEATSIASGSLAQLLAQRGEDGALRLPPGTVLVVDEASMVGTRDLHRLLAATDACAGRLLLLGDPHQLGPIDTGGLFTTLAATIPTLELETNQRQHAAWERRALAELRRGDIPTALAAYQTHHRVHVANDSAAAVRTLSAHYLHLISSGQDPEQVLALTATRADAASLNTAIRDRLRARGLIAAEELRIALPDGTERSYAAGDLVVITRNDHRRGLLNGDRGRIHSIEDDTLTVDFPDGRQARLDAAFLARGQLDHGYALTVHKAQGVTVDVALVYATAPLDRRGAYVALSRGRLANYLHTSREDLHPSVVPEAGRHPGAQPRREVDGVLSALAARITRRSDDRLAVAQLPDRERARSRASALLATTPNRLDGYGIDR